MKILYDTQTNSTQPYPRSDNEPVAGLDSKFITLDEIDAPPPEFDPATQRLTLRYEIDLEVLEYRQVWEIAIVPPVPNYQQFMDDLDLPPIGNGLYAELISDPRSAVYFGNPLALSIALQSEGIYALARQGASSGLGEKEIRNFQFRIDSIFALLSESQQTRLRSAITENNIPIVV